MRDIDKTVILERKQTDNSLDLQRNGREMERGDFVMPRKIMHAYSEVEGKFYAKDSTRLMFEDKGDKLTTSTTDKAAIANMVDYAKAKQWENLKLAGSQEFRREAWLQAESQGIKTSGFTPRAEDLAALKTLTQERSTNSITPLQERTKDRKEIAPMQETEKEALRHDINKNQAACVMGAEQGRTKHMTELQKKPEFGRYSIEELSKIAYFRSLLEEKEKNSPPNLRGEAIANFDAMMQDPKNVKDALEVKVNIEQKEKTKEHNQQRDTEERAL
jgi:Large polyvalent protein-associated domain 7